jgi:hypothetical protein
MFFAYLIAVLLAVGLSAVELVSGLQTRPTTSEGAWRWWLIRLLLEGGVGVLATVLLVKITHGDWNPLLLGLTAGASASAILRQNFTTLGDGTQIGIALAYSYFRNFFDDQIERCGSENDSKWINEEVLPTLNAAGVTASQIGRRLVDFIAGLGHMGDAQRIDEQAAIEKVLSEEEVSEEVKIEGLIRIGRRLKAFKTIANLCQTAKEDLAEQEPES